MLWSGKLDGASRASVQLNLPTCTNHVLQIGCVIVLFDTERNRSVFELSLHRNLVGLESFSWP
ncbi:hypothetical protein SynPROSU1_00962 [Synechococcus sp. PROS-U-1]|nr:hypothetical protein SynPROSU1_00962 [Synechococcus sp. PROS-U-1]